MKTRIVCTKNKGKSVPFNEHEIDVSHMTEEAQLNLLSLLRSGRDLGGQRRRVDGMKLVAGKGLVYESFNPSVDMSARLV